MVYKHLSFSREDTSSNVLNQIASKILSKYSSYFFADKKMITVSDPTKISSLKMTPKMWQPQHSKICPGSLRSYFAMGKK